MSFRDAFCDHFYVPHFNHVPAAKVGELSHMLIEHGGFRCGRRARAVDAALVSGLSLFWNLCSVRPLLGYELLAHPLRDAPPRGVTVNDKAWRKTTDAFQKIVSDFLMVRSRMILNCTRTNLSLAKARS